MEVKGLDCQTSQECLSEDMISRSDIQKISDLPIEQVADALGLTVKKHWSLCPFHSDSRPSLYYRVSANKYRCYVCEHYGGPVDLCMHVMNLNFHDAVCWLAQAFGIVISEEYRPFNVKPREVKPVRKEVPEVFDPTRFASMVAQPVLTEEARQFLFDERKLDPRVIQWCGISSTHTHLLIPYFGVDGTLQSIQWRYLGKHAQPQLQDEPRFRFPKGCQCHIYGLQILKMLKPGEPLYVTEGASDCWAMLSSGRKAIAIPSATLLKDKDIELLRYGIPSPLNPHPSPLNLHIFPDNDAPGEHLFLTLREHLPQTVRHQLPAGCKDFSDFYLQNVNL